MNVLEEKKNRTAKKIFHKVEKVQVPVVEELCEKITLRKSFS